MLCRRFSLSLAAVFLCQFSIVASAEPLATAGIGLQTCSKLTPTLKPAEGLDNPTNYLIFYWVQGYMTAANIATLEGDGDYIDLDANREDKILPLVLDFCTKNPDKKPITAIDKLLTEAPRIKGDWPKGTIEWAADSEKAAHK